MDAACTATSKIVQAQDNLVIALLMRYVEGATSVAIGIRPIRVNAIECTVLQPKIDFFSQALDVVEGNHQCARLQPRQVRVVMIPNQAMSIKKFRVLKDRCAHCILQGWDGRTRCLLSPFGSDTGRSTRFIFGPAVWIRSLIRPTEGYGIAYID